VEIWKDDYLRVIHDEVETFILTYLNGKEIPLEKLCILVSGIGRRVDVTVSAAIEK
jgi:hypothetical protein